MMPTPPARTSADARFKRPYRLRRARNAARRTGPGALNKLLLRLTAVVAVLLLATLAVVFQTERDPQVSAAPTLAPAGQ